MRRDFLQLAHTLDPAKHNIGGWFVSEKLDGTRCFWDGGITRGVDTRDVPWASVTDPKTGRAKAKVKPIATGLWSRYGNVIMAPDWFLNTLPATLLDGELYAGRGKFQLCRSICGGDTPDPRFDQIRYAVYSAPSVEQVFQTGEVKNANMLCWIDYLKCIEFFKDQLEVFEGDFLFSPARCFKEELTFLSQVFESQNKYCFPLKQERLPLDLGPAHVQVCRVLDEVVKLGGEGVVLRDPQAAWLPKRHAGILKYKPFHDCEVRITGFTSGRQTDKGSKHLGKIGALITEYRGKRLEVSGLTDEEREFLNSDMALTATERPGADMPKFFQGKHFKVGQTITILYRELSDDQIPKEARFLRKRETE